MDNYGAISFTVETQAGRFDDQIRSGRKTQTIRQPRKDDRAHVKVGCTTKLYWKMRRMSEGGYLIGYAEIISYEETCLLDMWYDEENAKADGFKDLAEFRYWFWSHRATGFHEWKTVPPLIKEAVKTSLTMSRETTKSMILVAANHQLGKSTTLRIMEYLLKPVDLIKWSLPLQ